MRTPGSSSSSVCFTRPIDSIRLCTKKTWPPRSSSASIASRMTSGRDGTTWVSIASRSRGGVSMIERSRRPESERWSERGIGVADMASTSIEAFHSLIRSFCATPKRCSSSTMSRPRSRKARSLPSMRCVAIRMSTVPSATFATMAFCSVRERNRERSSISTGNAAKRRLKVRKCWSARIVVGASTATCLPSSTAFIAARMATSVLP